MAVKVGRDLLPQLSERLKQYFPASATVNGLLNTILECGTERLEIWTDRWPDARAVLLCPSQSPDDKMAYIPRHRLLFAIDLESARNLLTERNVFQDMDTIEFAGVRGLIWPVVEEVARSNGFKPDSSHVGHMYYVPEGNLVESPPVPDGFELRTLTSDNAQTVTSTWAYGNSPEHVTFTESLIRLYPSMALFERSSGDLVAFALSYMDGALGNLFVIPSYRGRGFGKLVMSRLAHVMRDRGRPPFLYIEDNNEKSISLHKKLGFVVSSEETLSWAQFKRQ